MGINNSVFFCFRMAAGVKVPVALQMNCGFARVAMLELSRIPTGQSRANLDKEEHSEKFRSLFSENPNFNMPDKYYVNGWHTSEGSFNEHCNFMLECCNRGVGSSPGVGQLIDQSGDAAKGSEIEVCSVDHSARSAGKNFRLNFQLSGWALVALLYFED